MVFMSVLAATLGSPRFGVKGGPSLKPELTHLLWARRDETKHEASTLAHAAGHRQIWEDGDGEASDQHLDGPAPPSADPP